MDKLYGFDGDEYLHNDPQTVYENWVADNDFPACLEYDAEFDLPGLKALEIEEWSAIPASAALVDARDIAERVAEWFADDCGFEDAAEEATSAAGDPEVIAAFDVARDLMASKMRFWVADRKLRVLTVTWDENNEPLLDGEPMYRSAP